MTPNLISILTLSNSGLGIGTTPLALHTHGINTTVVEIDPVVHEFAVKYFSFPAEINAKLTDAIVYASDLVKEGVEKFDYIVHDVFTGGAEPVELFTVEFIGDLKSLLKPNGVVAIVSLIFSYLDIISIYLLYWLFSVYLRWLFHFPRSFLPSPFPKYSLFTRIIPNFSSYPHSHTPLLLSSTNKPH